MLAFKMSLQPKFHPQTTKSRWSLNIGVRPGKRYAMKLWLQLLINKGQHFTTCPDINAGNPGLLSLCETITHGAVCIIDIILSPDALPTS